MVIDACETPQARATTCKCTKALDRHQHDENRPLPPDPNRAGEGNRTPVFSLGSCCPRPKVVAVAAILPANSGIAAVRRLPAGDRDSPLFSAVLGTF